jgi:hypothetical protein
VRRAETLLVVTALVLAACSPTDAPSASSSQIQASPVTPSASAPALVDASPSASSFAPPPTPGSVGGVGVLPGEPDPSRTPGATNPAVTQATIGSTICLSGWTATVRPPSSYTTALKREQIAEYGYTDTNLADYEEDHLIPLELGGAPSDPRNLWPEPYSAHLADGTPDGARVKDQLENRLRALVCGGTLRLATAQQAIATDWVRAWQIYVAPGAAIPSPAGATATPTPSPAVAPVAAGRLTVTISSLTSPISPGSAATLAARTAPGAVCSIAVVYKSGPSSAAGLAPATAGAGGDVRWTWTVGSRTSAGSWPVTVTCSAGGASASAGATLVVG